MTNVKSGILARFYAPITKLALSLCAIGAAMNILGDPVQWDAGGEDNYWSTGANWVGDVAPDGVGANFDLWDLEGEQTVEFSDDASAAGMYVWSYGNRAAYKFVGNNKTLTLSATTQLASGDIAFTNLNVTFSGSELRLAGDRNGDIASLTQDGGTVALHGWTYIGGGWNNEYSGCKGEYTLKGNGSFGGNDDFHIAWGDSCTGIVSIVNGTVSCTYRTMLGEGPNSKSSLTVGENSSWNCGSFYMASGANANAEAENNGTLTVGGDFVIGQGEGSSATFTLGGGTTTAASMTCGSGTGKVVFNGGTAVATTAADGDFIPATNNYTVTIGNNGGTISNANDISISAAITGSGWLTKTGAGTLRLSDVAGFTGRIAVAENAVTVTLPASATNIKVGANTTKEVTENGIVFSYSATDYSNADNYWTGKGTGNDWATTGNWDTGLVGANNYVFHSGTLLGVPVSVEFADAYAGDGSLYIQNGAAGLVTFSKAQSAANTAGISLSGGINVGTSDLGSLKLESGSYSAGWMDIGTGAGDAKLTISGGDMVVSGEVQIGRATDATATVDMTGGSLVAKSYLALSRGANNLTGPTGIKTTFNLSGGEVRQTAEAGNWTHLSIGAYNAPGSTADFNVTGGELSGATDIYVGENHKGSLNVSGTGVVTTPANIKLGVESNGDGTLTLGADGSVTCAAITIGSGSASVTLSGGTLVAGADGTFIPASDKLTVAVDGNATLDTNGKTITIDAAMLGDGTLTCVGGGTVTFTSLDSTCTIVQAEDGTIVNKPQVYYWVGGASGDWNDGSNWSLSADGDAANVYPNTVSDAVVIGTPATITLTGNVVVHEVVVAADVVFSGEKSLGFATMRGDGLVTMSNVTFRITGEDFTPFEVYNNIFVAAGTQNTLNTENLISKLRGNLSGTGDLKVSSTYAKGHGYEGLVGGGVWLYGENGEFSGRFDASDTTRNNTSFYYGNASSSNAVWKLRGNDVNINETTMIRDSSTYYFGALLEGSLLQSTYNRPTLEVGARDEVASKADLRGRGTDSNGRDFYFNITKVGTNVFTVVDGDTKGFIRNYGNILIKGGVLEFPCVPKYATYITFAGEGATLRPTTSELDFSALIKNSTSAIIIDDSLSGYSTWDTALDSSNKGGLIKDGYGTLTLTKVPQYSGATVVKDGKLVVPFGTALSTLELGVNATVEVDMKDAAANATAFSVGKIVGDKSKISLVNNTSGVEFTLVETATGLVYVNGSRSFTWVGPTVIDETTDISWSTPANWGSESNIPTSADTVTIPAGKEVYVDVAASVLAITATGDVTIKGPANAKTSLAATSFVGSGSLTVSENVALSIGVMDVDGKITMTQSNIDSNSYADNLGDANVGTMDIANGFSGSGSLVNNGSLTLSGNDSFIGTIGGGQSVVKKGDDTYMLIGNNTFTGGLAIEKGTLKLGSPKDIADVRMDFDASDADSLTVDEATGYVTAWKDQINNLSFNYASGQHATISRDFFGELSAISLLDTEEPYSTQGRSLVYKLSENNATRRSKMLFIAYCAADGSDSQSIYSENEQANFHIRVRGSASNHYWVWYNGGGQNQITTGFYLNGINGTRTISQKPEVVTVADTIIRNKTNGGNACTEVIGSLGATNDKNPKPLSCFNGAIGEIISYNRNLTHAERKAVDAYLMAKWGVGTATYNVIPANADVTMKSGATLDMGGLTQTVTSFTGAGTVANGYLKTTGDLTVDGGTLTIQATTGQTYVLSDVETERLVLTGNAKDYTVKVPDNGRIVGRFIVPAGISVGFEGEGADVTVVNAPTGWEITGKPVAGGILYRVGSFPFVLKLR